MFLPRITQEEFLETKIRSVFLEFIGYCRREMFLSVVKDSTAVLVLKALGSQPFWWLLVMRRQELLLLCMRNHLVKPIAQVTK